MRRAALIVNPAAGRGSGFATHRDRLMRVFAAREIAVEVAETTAAPGSARELAVRAAERCELVIACGGDGTVHGVLQGVANSAACLGVLPLGTANALARNLRLPLDPAAALERLLSFEVRRIPLGLAETATGTHWFVVMAGAGPDGRLVHEMSAAAKVRAGRQAYYIEAARLFATRRFPAFQVEYRLVGSEVWQRRNAVGMMASRIPNLGGLFGRLTPGSRLHHPHLLVQLLAAPAHLAFPAWMGLGRLGLSTLNPWLTIVEADELRCLAPEAASPTYSQVDGEATGAIPLSIRVIPDALNMLMPDA